MKKTFKTFTLMLLTALAFSSCVDVPAPYNLPEKDGENAAGTAIEPQGEGTLASPYNVAAIVAKIKEMEAGVESTQEYYIKGKVSNVKTVVNDFPKYGNHTFEMIDEGNSSTVFTAFQVNGPNKQKFPAFDDINVGDEVVVCGRVVNYRGNTPETVGKGEAYVVSINASGSGSGSQTDDGTAITCAEAVALTNALENGATSTETYSVTGYITEVVGSVSRNQQTFWMADTKDGGRIFEAYYANLPEGVTEFTVGMKVKITGQLMKFVNNSGNVTCEMKNPNVVILPDDGGETPPAVDGIPVTCAEAVQITNTLANGATSSETYTITGYITEVIGNVSRNQQSFWMADTKDGGRVFEAYWADLPTGVSQFVKGMKVQITGKLMKYVNNTSGEVTPEIKNATVVILEEGGGETPPAGDAIPVTCAEAVQQVNALANGATSTDVYAVTGYITEVISDVSEKTGTPQQSFWMADTKDGGQVFEAYWANLPEGVAAFTVGSKVTITGNLKKYVKDNVVTPEIQNATVVILEAGEGSGGDTPEPPTPGPGGEEVTDLVNGDFESWVSDAEATGWKSASSASNATVSKSTDARNGSYACCIAAPGSTNKRLATQEMTLEAGSYTFSYYAKSSTSSPCQTRGGFVPVNDDNSVGTYKYGDYVDINSNGWTLVTYDFELTEKTKLCLLVMNPKNSTYSVSQDILVDDATLVKK